MLKSPEQILQYIDDLVADSKANPKTFGSPEGLYSFWLTMDIITHFILGHDPYKYAMHRVDMGYRLGDMSFPVYLIIEERIVDEDALLKKLVDIRNIYEEKTIYLKEKDFNMSLLQKSH